MDLFIFEESVDTERSFWGGIRTSLSVDTDVNSKKIIFCALSRHIAFGPVLKIRYLSS